MSDSISTLKNKGLPADALAFIESCPLTRPANWRTPCSPHSKPKTPAWKRP